MLCGWYWMAGGGITTEQAEKMKVLEREVRELK